MVRCRSLTAGRSGRASWTRPGRPCSRASSRAASRASALQAFLDANLPPALSLFVNVEPEAIAVPCPPDLAGVVAHAESVLRVFVELNDLALAYDPSGALATVDRARRIGWGIAMDDVGVSRAPLAMLPVVHADVVKLDLRLLAGADEQDAAAIAAGVLRHVEHNGATLLVEGIETEDDAEWARALGARHGQGFLLGAPGPMRAHYPMPRAAIHLVPAPSAPSADEAFESPFELLTGHAYQHMPLALLVRLVTLIAYSPRAAGSFPAFLVGLSRDGLLPPGLVEHVGATRGATLLWAVFGSGIDAEPAPGVRGVRLRPADPLADERFLVVLSDQSPLAVFARGCPDGQYDVVVTQDGELVHTVAYQLIRRMPSPGGDHTALASAARAEEGHGAGGSDGEQVPGARSRGWRGRLSGGR